MSSYKSTLSKSEIIERFQKEIAKAKEQPVDGTGYATTFDGTITEDGIIIWDDNIAWENKMHAKIVVTEKEGASIVQIIYKPREGFWFRLLIPAIVVFVVIIAEDKWVLLGSLICLCFGFVYDWFRLLERREPIEEYVKKTIA